LNCDGGTEIIVHPTRLQMEQLHTLPRVSSAVTSNRTLPQWHDPEWGFGSVMGTSRTYVPPGPFARIAKARHAGSDWGVGTQGTRGILNPVEGFAHFSLERQDAPGDLATFVDRFWQVRWDLDGRPPFDQEILPYPCVNVSFRSGAFEVHGPGTRRFVAQLTGRGRVFGTKFTPAGFSRFASLPMRSLCDRVVSLEEATGRQAPQVRDDEPATVRAAITEFLRGFSAKPDDDIPLVDRLVARAQEDRSIARAEDLARVAGTSVRSLHRLFERHVGVGPKWVVRRSRVQEAADRVARGERVDWAATAQDLGYHDQAHLIGDFRTQVGFTPAAYARRCAAAARRTMMQTTRNP
jgi:AraC-like DNA-binding protein